MNRVLLFIGLTLGFLPLSFATDLMDVYFQALQNDPSFKQAYSTYLSTKESVPIARAALYPQLTVGALAGRYVQNVTLGAIDGQQTYNSNSWQVNASQAVFNFQAWAQVQKAKASVRAAEATFNDAAQDLILRVAKAYLDVLLARDTLEFAEAKKRANKRQLEQATERFKVGLDAITSVYEAKAGYDQSVAEVITAENNRINQNENLRKLTNHVYEFLVPLRDSRIPLITPEPNRVDDWIDVGIRQNFKLYAAKFNLEAARDNIKVQAAGGTPVVSVQANSNQVFNNVGSVSFFAPNQQMTSNIAIAMNFPIIQGGLVVAQTRQAQYDFESSSEQLEKAYRDVVVNTRIGFNNITDGISKVKADRQTVVSRVNSLNSTEAQFEVGTRTMVDVVNAQQQLFESQRQLANDQYTLIGALLNLKYLAGSLNVADLEEVNSWLKTTRIAAYQP